MENCERFHKLQKWERLYFAAYSLDDEIPFRVLESMVGKWISKAEFKLILRTCTASFCRRWHSLFVWDDVGSNLFKQGHKNLALKIFKIP